MTNRIIFILFIGLVYEAFGQTTSSQIPEPDYDKYRREHLSVGIAASYAYFNSSITILDKSNDRTTFLSPEGMLGLDKSQFIPTIYGFWQPGRRHWVGFSYFAINREGESVSVDRDIGNIEINGDIFIADRSAFYYLSYNYALFYDDRSYVLCALGLYGLHIKMQFDAEGEISENGVPFESKFYNEKIDRFAAFPLLGLQAQFFMKPKLLIGASASLIGGNFSGLKAFIFESKLLSRFIITKNISIIGELMFFNADLEFEDEKQKTNTGYGFTALFIGIDVGF